MIKGFFTLDEGFVPKIPKQDTLHSEQNDDLPEQAEVLLFYVWERQ